MPIPAVQMVKVCVSDVCSCFRPQRLLKSVTPEPAGSGGPHRDVIITNAVWAPLRTPRPLLDMWHTRTSGDAPFIHPKHPQTHTRPFCPAGGVLLPARALAESRVTICSLSFRDLVAQNVMAGICHCFGFVTRHTQVRMLFYPDYIQTLGDKHVQCSKPHKTSFHIYIQTRLWSQKLFDIMFMLQVCLNFDLAAVYGLGLERERNPFVGFL